LALSQYLPHRSFNYLKKFFSPLDGTGRRKGGIQLFTVHGKERREYQIIPSGSKKGEGTNRKENARRRERQTAKQQRAIVETS
jgi:hypothetical protein